MKILVTIKRVIDPYVKIRVKSDGSGVEKDHVKMAMNPFDEIAVEEAVRLLEKGLATEIVVVSIGDTSSQETLRHALALGATRGILVTTQESLVPLNVAKVLKALVEKENPELILMGKQSIDADNNQTPQILSTLLNWPQATFASKIECHQDKIQVTREIDGGLETLELNLPAVVSTDLRLNEPRYATLPNIMQSKRKPIDIIDLQSLNLNLKPHLEVIKIQPPHARQGGVFVSTVDELIDKLKNEAKVLG